MGLKFYDVELLGEAFARGGVDFGGKVVTLGVQDVYFSYEELRGFMKEKGIPGRELSAGEILPTTGFGWAGPKERARAIHQKTVFGAMGFQTSNVWGMDGSGYEKPEIVHDLNVPVGKELEGAFDVVFDGGTVEHVFSVKDAFFNVARMVKVGGLAVHHGPVDWPDHGFVNFNPTLLRDFYLANGFEEVDLRFTAVGLADDREYRFYPEFPGYLRPAYGLLLWGAYKKVREGELSVPVQGRYREVWAKTQNSKLKTQNLG